MLLLLWTGVKRTAAEGTRRYRIATVAGGVIARVVVCLVPPTRLCSTCFPAQMALGFAPVAFMVAHDVRLLTSLERLKRRNR